MAGTTTAPEITIPRGVFEPNLILRLRLCELRPILPGRARVPEVTANAIARNYYLSSAMFMVRDLPR
jgi:hypothetical protein